MQETQDKCPECSEPIPPSQKGDFWGCCSFKCHTVISEKRQIERESGSGNAFGKRREVI